MIKNFIIVRWWNENPIQIYGIGSTSTYHACCSNLGNIEWNYLGVCKVTETVDQFLARGGQIKSLDMGYTAFPDGIIPMKPPRSRETKESQAKKDEKIKEYNAKIPRVKKARVKPKKRIPQEQIINLVAEQTTMLSDIYRKFKRGDKKRFCDLCGVVTKSMDNAKAGNGRFSADTWDRIKEQMKVFVFSTTTPKKKIKYKPKESPEYTRRLQVIEARKKAESDGVSVFTAPCKIHGMTDYYLHGKQPPRCAKCRMAITKHHREMHKDAKQKDRSERARINKERTIKAIAKNEINFTGLCVRCGYTEMKIYASKKDECGYSYRCVECTHQAQVKYNLTRNAK